jgi:hypothetical protein
MIMKLFGLQQDTHMPFTQHHFLNFFNAQAQSPWLLGISTLFYSVVLDFSILLRRIET